MSEQPLYEVYYHSEIGLIHITGTEEGVASLHFIDKEAPPENTEVPECLADCVQQIDEYFNDNRKTFSLKLAPEGTYFQKKVWEQLLAIPHGKTTSYGEIATGLGDKNAMRAVGSATGRNPISIIVPCHRVIGSNGKLIGYGGGLWRKEWLLKHEGSILI